MFELLQTLIVKWAYTVNVSLDMKMFFAYPQEHVPHIQSRKILHCASYSVQGKHMAVVVCCKCPSINNYKDFLKNYMYGCSDVNSF